MSSRCFKCNSEGLIGGCPDCGQEMLLGVRYKEKDITNKELDNLLVPRFYKSNRWNITTLKEHYIDYVGGYDFDRYCEQLEKGYKIFSSGALPNTSMLICSPIGYSKTTWAYSCIIKAYEHQYNVTPVIDSSQLKRLLVTASEKPSRTFVHDGFNLQQYLSSDILFVTVTKGPEYVYAFEVIIQILDIRSRLDKPTIILSDYSQRDLIVFDHRRMLERLITAKGTINPYKYPASIAFYPIKDF